MSRCGLDYGKCTLNAGDSITDEPKKDFESGMSDYCLLLPETKEVEGDDARRYAVVYHDWDVWNHTTGKGLPRLQESLFL